MAAGAAAAATATPETREKSVAVAVAVDGVWGGLDDSSDVDKEQELELIRTIAPVVALTVTCKSMLFSARIKAAGRFIKNPVLLTTTLSRLASCGAFAEFVLNPIFGKLSDTFGRKLILPLGPISLLFCNTLMFMRPQSLWPLILEELVATPLVTSFFTTWRAALSDVLQGGAFARTQAKIGMAAGIGLLCGPFISKTIMRNIDVKWCYAASAVCAAIATARLAFFSETLLSSERRPFSWQGLQPFSFLELVDKGPTLRRLLCITGMQTVTELRNVNQVFSVYMEKDLKWSWDRINNFTAAFGLSLIFSGAAVKKMIAVMGMRKFTTFCNSSNALSYLIFSGMGPFSFLFNSPLKRMWLGLFAAAAGGRKRDCVEALVMKQGARAGLGRGFVSGSLMNFRAIVNVVAPILLSQVYARGARQQQPEMVFLFGALASITAETIWQSLSDEALVVDNVATKGS